MGWAFGAGGADDPGGWPRSVAGGDVGGAIGVGSLVAGSSESAGRYLTEVMAKTDGSDIENAAIASLHDLVVQAAAGYLRLLTPPTNPRVIGLVIADAVTGQYAAQAWLAALLERTKPAPDDGSTSRCSRR